MVELVEAEAILQRDPHKHQSVLNNNAMPLYDPYVMPCLVMNSLGRSKQARQPLFSVLCVASPRKFHYQLDAG